MSIDPQYKVGTWHWQPASDRGCAEDVAGGHPAGDTARVTSTGMGDVAQGYSAGDGDRAAPTAAPHALGPCGQGSMLPIHVP